MSSDCKYSVVLPHCAVGCLQCVSVEFLDHTHLVFCHLLIDIGDTDLICIWDTLTG